MKEYSPDSIRNIVFIGHGGSGKTSLSEILLYTTHEINRIGSVAEGNTISDYTQNEIEKQISISTSALHFEWEGVKINLLDTPGYTDFVGDVKAALKVCDTAVMVLKSAEGIEVGTELTGSFINEFALPSAIIINKVDNEHSTFFETYEKSKKRLTSGATIITFPVKEGINFNSVIDILKMKMYEYGDAGSRKVNISDIPSDLLDKANELRTFLIEKVAESSEDLMNKYFEEGSLTEEEIKSGLKMKLGRA